MMKTSVRQTHGLFRRRRLVSMQTPIDISELEPRGFSVSQLKQKRQQRAHDVIGSLVRAAHRFPLLPRGSRFHQARRLHRLRSLRNLKPGTRLN